MSGVIESGSGPWSSLLLSNNNNIGYGYGYGYILGPSPVPPIYLAGSFSLVRPAWIKYTRSAVPQNVEGPSPDLPAQRPRRLPIPCTLAARPEGVDVNC